MRRRNSISNLQPSRSVALSVCFLVIWLQLIGLVAVSVAAWGVLTGQAMVASQVESVGRQIVATDEDGNEWTVAEADDCGTAWEHLTIDLPVTSLVSVVCR